MRSRTLIPTATIVLGYALGWLVATNQPAVSFAQKSKSNDSPTAQAPAGTASVLPRPDFHFPGTVGRTYLDSDKAQFP
jgi:hypothetical protein